MLYNEQRNCTCPETNKIKSSEFKEHQQKCRGCKSTNHGVVACVINTIVIISPQSNVNFFIKFQIKIYISLPWHLVWSTIISTFSISRVIDTVHTHLFNLWYKIFCKFHKLIDSRSSVFYLPFHKLQFPHYMRKIKLNGILSGRGALW